MMWWSGLRGAIAFALSLQAVQDLPGEMCSMLMIASASAADLYAAAAVEGNAGHNMCR